MQIKCILMRNPCWAKYHGVVFVPSGIVVHSTAPAGGVLRRFVQPYAGQTEGLEIDGKAVSEAEMRDVLGSNPYANDWNRATVPDGKGGQKALDACVHDMIGKLADGSYADCQTLDWTQPCWGSGSGPKGSYNGCQGGVAREPLYIQFEMIEDANGDRMHCQKLYEMAVNLCVRLMREFPSVRLENVISHREANLRGMGSNHGDPENYWKRCGMSYTMDSFRRAVEAKLRRFSDVPNDAYYAAAVDWAVEHGITNGTGADTFSPDKPCTRAQVVTFLWRAAGAPVPAAKVNPFQDVTDGQYYTDAVLWAVEQGITIGVAKNRFAPDSPCTRGQIVTFLWRFGGRIGQEDTAIPFKDVPPDAYYYVPVLWAVENAITKGVDGTSFAPDVTCTRAQVVTFLWRMQAESG